MKRYQLVSEPVKTISNGFVVLELQTQAPKKKHSFYGSLLEVQTEANRLNLQREVLALVGCKLTKQIDRKYSTERRRSLITRLREVVKR